jgi:hypothetical protein
MKNLFLSIGLVLAGMFVSGNATAQVELSKGPKINFNKEVHDYGQVKYDGDGTCSFDFTNEGNEALVISNAKGSCGCTVPNKPEEAILPGQIGELDVIFSPKEGQRGTPVSKQVTVIANTNPASTVLEIKANVLGPKG